MGSEPLHLIIDVAWVADHGVGAADIDAEHRELFRMLEQMQAHYAAGEEGPCRALIKDFARALPAHFAREEAQFLNLPYPGADHHIAQHAILARRAEAIADAAGSMPMVRHTLADLIEGLAVVMMTDHLTLDLELRRYLIDQRTRADTARRS